MTPGEFFSTLLEAVDVGHQLHLSTDSFSVHKALEDFYGDLPDAVDALAEVVQGIEGKIASFPEPAEREDQEPPDFLRGLLDFVEANRKVLGDRSAVQALVDDVVAVIARAIYRVEQLS